MHNITDMESASIAMADDYINSPSSVRSAYIGHIHKLVDKELMGTISFEEFCNFMAISAIVANKAVILANEFQINVIH